ncbi:MAG TPA: LURP-one-related family protein [Candidatus Limnocylindrales bacterium]|nr:LURP-one-related family protein [Candidatus Limnocylindrales bacterium]
MPDGSYQRTCNKCGTQWPVPAEFAEERPNLGDVSKAMFASLASVQDQMKLRQHYMQLGSYAKCPNCGATSFTQQQIADATDAAAGASATAAATSPAAAATPTAAAPAPAAAPSSPGQPRIFVLNQKLVSLTGDSWIEDEQGHQVYEVDGQLLSLRGTHVLKDASGQELYEVSKPLAPHLHRTIEIKKAGQTVATAQEALFNLTGDKFTITLASGGTLVVKGDWIDREFKVSDSTGAVVMVASRAWFTIRDAYGIQIWDGFEVPLGLAIAIALERVEAEERGEQSPLQNLLGGLGGFGSG